MTALVTVIIPHHRSTQPYLWECIDSVLEQTSKDKCELLVVVDVNNQGPAWARNHGARMTTTPWLLLLDADDTIHPEFVEKALTASMMGRPFACDVVVPSTTRLSEAILYDNYLPYCAMIRTPVWRYMAGHQEPCKAPEDRGLCDWDWWIRCFKSGLDIGYIDEGLFHHRDREDSMSKWSGEKFHKMRKELWSLHGINQ